MLLAQALHGRRCAAAGGVDGIDDRRDDLRNVAAEAALIITSATGMRSQGFPPWKHQARMA